MGSLTNMINVFFKLSTNVPNNWENRRIMSDKVIRIYKS